jgi:hypothetical protein
MDSICIYPVVIDSLQVNILLQVHVLIFSIFVIFGPFFYVFWQKSSSFANSFQKLLPQGSSNKYSPLRPGNHYSKWPPRIPHRHFIH